MANYQFSADLVNDILFRAGEPTDGTSDFNATALQYLNRAYQALWMGGTELNPTLHEEWWWLRKDPPGVLTLNPVISAGTVNVANNSTSVTFSSAPIPSVAGLFFKVDTHADVFRIASHTAGAAAATLDAVYTGLTNATANYRLMQLEYSLANDLLKVLAPMRTYQNNISEIGGESLSALERDFPVANVRSGTPTQFAHVTETKVRFNRYGGNSSTEFMHVEYDYLYRPAALTNSGTEEPVVPLHYRRVLSDFASHLLFSDKNDDRAERAGLMAKSLVNAMATENRQRLVAFARDMGKIYPRRTDRFIGPLRTQSGLIIG